MAPPDTSVFGGRKTLAIMLTYTCPAQCTHCGTVSSPHDKHNVDLATALHTIDQAHALDFENVVFTGGEATLRWDDLLAAIRHAAGLGFHTRLVTNAHWATSAAVATDTLDLLLAAGLHEINFSTGDEHARFIPLERVIYAAVATVQRGLSAFIMVELRSEGGISGATILQHPAIRQLPDAQRALIQPTESPWMPLSPFTVAAYPPGITTNQHNRSRCSGCDSVLQTYVLQADGRIGACCGLGMRIIPELSVARAEGSAFLAQAIAEAEDDFLKIWLRYKGPEAILAWAASHDATIAWEDMYAHRCQACLRVYRDPQVGRVIREHYQEVVGEVIQSAWLREHYIPLHMPAMCRTSPADPPQPTP